MNSIPQEETGMEKPTSIFNVELTTFPRVTDDLLHDIAALGYEPVAPAELIPSMRPVEKRRQFEQWCVGRDPEALDPVWERTSSRAASRLSEWAGLVLRREKELGHDVGFYSTAVMDDCVNALADGLESEFGFSIDVVTGTDMERDSEGLFTGTSEGIYKASFLETLEVREHRTWEFIADSFMNALPAVRKARRPLLVNPESRLQGAREARTMDVLFAGRRDTDLVMLRKGNQAEVEEYDLQISDDRERFLEDLYSDT